MLNNVLIDQLHEVVAEPNTRTGLACEPSLHVAAAMLARASAGEMTATRVVGVLGRDDQEAFQSLVFRIAEEYGLVSHFELKGGGFSVRFSR